MPSPQADALLESLQIKSQMSDNSQLSDWVPFHSCVCSDAKMFVEVGTLRG